MSNFFKEFDAEWLAISGEFLEKGAKIRPTPNVGFEGFGPFCRLLRGLFLAKATSLGGERYLDFEQNGPNQNHQDFPFRLLDHSIE